MGEFNSRTWITEIKVPCLVIAADKDIIYDAVELKEMAELIPHAKYHCFHNVGHLPHIEQPEEFCELILKFLKAHS